MINRIYRIFLLTILFFPHQLLSQHFLNEEAVRKTTNKLIEYHIDNKEISTPILSKSITSYIKIFDYHRVYFTEQEWSSEINNPNIKKNILKQFQTNNLSQFKKVNTKIKQTILRARDWRNEWEKNPVDLISQASSLKYKKHKQFAATLQNLKTRHLYHLLSYIATYLEDEEQARYKGKEDLLVKLCEKQIRYYENEYLGINELGETMSEEEENHHIFTRVIKSIANTLDAHTAYFSKEEALAMRIQLEKGMCGIGVVLREDIFGITVKEILPGGPADLSQKIFPKDIIYGVNGESIQHISFKGVLDILRGNEGSTVTLNILKENGDKVDVLLTRSKIHLSDKRVDVSSEPFGNGVIGKITLHSFYEGDGQVSSESDLRKALYELKKKNLLGVVLDIRENNGGFLSQAVKVSGLFMKNGVAVVSKYSDGTIRRYRTLSKTKFFDGPLVVLVSKSSASASEIVAQTLKDYGLAVIVGDNQTYGKGTIQHQTITSRSSARGEDGFFKVTVGKYYSPSGCSTQIEGVKSDIVVSTHYGEERLGERFLDNPLPADHCINVIRDDLEDLEPSTKKWFQTYYLPDLQEKEDRWTQMMPVLVQNSQNRIENNKNFQHFLKSLKKDTSSQENYGSNDLQMEESVNILKDMIFLSQQKNIETK